jgi:predicted dehydrogenase
MTLIRGSKLTATSVLKAQANALENGGGCLLDYGSHGLAGALSLFGPDYRPVKVEAVSIGTLFPNRILENEPCLVEVDDNARIKVMLENTRNGSWATIYLEASWCGGHIGRTQEKPGGQSGGYLEIVGDAGWIESHESTSITVHGWDGGVEKIPVIEYPGETISMATEVRTFLDCMASGTVPETDIRFGADVIAICGAAYLSAIRGKAITLAQFKSYCEGFTKKLGDREAADDAIVMELLAPYRRR